MAVAIELVRIKGEPLLTYCKKYDLYTNLEKVNMWRLPQLKWKSSIFRKYLDHIGGDTSDHAPVYAHKYFKLIDQQYPGSKFILNTRSV